MYSCRVENDEFQLGSLQKHLSGFYCLL